MSKRLKPVHPGEVLREEFRVPLKLTMNSWPLTYVCLRLALLRSSTRAGESLQITVLTLAGYFNTTAQFWMNSYDLEMAEDTRLQKINREVQPAPALAGAAH